MFSTHLNELSAIFIIFEIVVCKLFENEIVWNLSFGKGLMDLLNLTSQTTDLCGRIILWHRAPDTGSDGSLNRLLLFQTLFCGYSLESSLWDDSNEYPQHGVLCTIFDTLYYEISWLPLNCCSVDNPKNLQTVKSFGLCHPAWTLQVDFGWCFHKCIKPPFHKAQAFYLDWLLYKLKLPFNSLGI